MFPSTQLVVVVLTETYCNKVNILQNIFSLHRTHNKSPPAVDIGYGQTVAGDPHRTAASRHIRAAHPG